MTKGLEEPNVWQGGTEVDVDRNWVLGEIREWSSDISIAYEF